MPEIQTAVLEILGRILQMPLTPDAMDTDLFDENLLDSFGVTQMVVALSERFNIEIPPATFERKEWSTPRTIIMSVRARIASQHPPHH